MKPVSVKMTYRLRGDPNDEPHVVRLTPDNVPQQHKIGLAPGVEAVKPEAGSYEYSGMHDNGALIPPKEGGGVMAQLIQCVRQAKEVNNAYMTDIIQQEKQQQQPETLSTQQT